MMAFATLACWAMPPKHSCRIDGVDLQYLLFLMTNVSTRPAVYHARIASTGRVSLSFTPAIGRARKPPATDLREPLISTTRARYGATLPESVTEASSAGRCRAARVGETQLIGKKQIHRESWKATAAAASCWQVCPNYTAYGYFRTVGAR